MELLIKFAKPKSTGNYGYTNDYKNPDAVDKVVKYILRKDGRQKSNGIPGNYDLFGSIGTYHKDVIGIINDFKKLKKIHSQTDGVQIKHLIISFSKTPDITPRKLKKLLNKILKYFSTEYQLVYAVHEDTEHLHIHIGINSVSFTGKKFSFKAKDQKKFMEKTRKIFKDYK